MDNSDTTDWHIDREIKDYQSFIDYEWVKRVDDKVTGTPYQKFYDRLLFQWKGTANTSRMPVTVVQVCKAYNYGATRSNKPRPLRLINELASKSISNVLPSLNAEQVGRIIKNIRELESNVERDYKKLVPKFDKQEVWDTLLGIREFSIAILVAERICYANLFFAYEDFLIKVLKKITSRESIRTTDKKEFKKIIKEALSDDEAYNNYWGCDDINIPKLVRNAISHAGGDETDELKGVKHGIEVIDERLQITATHTRQLYVTLSQAVENLVDQLTLGGKC